MKTPFSPVLGGRFGETARMPGVGFWYIDLSFLPTALLIRPSTTSTVLALTLTALPLTMWAWVKAERVLGLLMTIPPGGRGGSGEEGREVDLDPECEPVGVRWAEEEGVWGLEWAT